jgi:hypothetical protein
MNKYEATDINLGMERIRSQIAGGNIRITQHAHKEMAEENITLDQVLEAIEKGHILENYPNHRRGSCCLINGLAGGEQPLHVVCTTSNPTLIIITVYVPKPPKWITAAQRR